MNKHHVVDIYLVIPIGSRFNLVQGSILCRSRTLPRTVWMTCTQIIMIITYLLLAFAIDGTLYVAIAFLGICFGVQFSTMIPTVSELFGLKNFGLLSNFMSLGNPIGAFLFSGLLAGYVYDNEAAKQHRLVRFSSSLSCLGPDCFRITFLVLAFVCAVGTILSIVLTRRIKPVYQTLYSGGSFRLPPNTNH
jgi:MFS family permease